jgi:hypothetical protein
MRPIRTDDELSRLHNAGVGLIYNDYSGRGPSGARYNVLHAAHCSWVVKSNTKIPKIFFDAISEAEAWLSSNRGPEGSNWKRCGSCLAKSPDAKDSVTIDTTRSPHQVHPTPTAISPFTESRVEDALVPWLEGHGYTVRKRVTAFNGIIDLEATGPDGRWLIEAKGEDRGGLYIGRDELPGRDRADRFPYGRTLPTFRSCDPSDDGFQAGPEEVPGNAGI